jgi:methionyl-tRNA synthetase
LAPRALRGVESEGMLLLANDANGKLVFVNPDADGVDNGALIS